MREQGISPDAPRWDIRVDGKSLPELHRALIDRVKLYESLDGGASVEIGCGGLDQDLNYRFIDESLLFPGVEFDLWAGYGGNLVPKGRYKVKHHDFNYDAEGVPGTIEAYDKLAWFLKDTQGRIIEGAQSHADAIVKILETDYPSIGYVIQSSNEKAGDRIKKVGDTDLAFFKNLAIADGFAYPRNWSKEQYDYIKGKVDERLATDAIAQMSTLIAYTKIKPNNLVYLPLESVYSFLQPVTFWYSPKGQSDFDSLRVFFSEADMPIGIEVYGTTTIDGVRKLVKVVVRWDESGPDIKVYADGWEDQWQKEQKIRDQIKNGGMLLFTLGSGTKVVETGASYTSNKQKKGQPKKASKPVTGKSEVEVNEVLNGDGVLIGSDLDVVEYAKRWFQQRSASFLLGEARLSNTPGLELLGINQIHSLAGVASTHAGPFVTTTCTQEWIGSGHEVSFSFQKLVREQDLVLGGVGPKFNQQDWTT